MLQLMLMLMIAVSKLKYRCLVCDWSSMRMYGVGYEILGGEIKKYKIIKRIKEEQWVTGQVVKMYLQVSSAT